MEERFLLTQKSSSCRKIALFRSLFREGYEAVGYKILLPASAIPGWPAEVSLPVDPAWKVDYAASVKRLVRDGIDLPLAHLFVQVATVLLDDQVFIC